MSVQLRIYDLSNGMAAALSEAYLGVKMDGIWHTSLVLFGREWEFGGGGGVSLSGQRTGFDRAISLGTTSKTEAEWGLYLKSCKQTWAGSTYNLLNRNCNHWTEDAAKFLGVQSIPADIKDQTPKFLNSPLGQMLKPRIDQMFNQKDGPDAEVAIEELINTATRPDVQAHVRQEADKQNNTGMSRTLDMPALLTAEPKWDAMKAVLNDQEVFDALQKADLEKLPTLLADSDRVKSASLFALFDGLRVVAAKHVLSIGILRWCTLTLEASTQSQKTLLSALRMLQNQIIQNEMDQKSALYDLRILGLTNADCLKSAVGALQAFVVKLLGQATLIQDEELAIGMASALNQFAQISQTVQDSQDDILCILEHVLQRHPLSETVLVPYFIALDLIPTLNSLQSPRAKSLISRLAQ